MTALSTPRLRAPTSVVAGEPFEVRVTVAHPMETGYRRDTGGVTIPRHIATRVVARLDGTEAFRADLGPGIAANPYFSFHLMLDRAAELRVEFEDDDGEHQHIAQFIDVPAAR